eukprot:PhM_4_TR18611/c4_g1_i3/m.83755/K10251/HSD17B12, KAR, IFA38; 17beta-estradiol 17-dehydrogenase / very-long-chain 3-oxoacyl-CoA reductase
MCVMSPQFVAGLAMLGAAFIGHRALKIANWLRISFLTSTNLIKRYGNGTTTPWAVVTGASDGIGKALAMQCARRGLNVVLVSRTLSKLHDVEAEIKKRYPTTEVRIVVLDFAKTTASDVAAAVQKHMSDIDVAVLINNVGINTNRVCYLDEATCERYDELIHVNCAAPTHMTYALLPQLKSRKSRSAIVNLSSVSAVVDCPYLAVYGATKAFNYQFSLALGRELTPENIDVMAVCPGVVMSSMSGVKRESFACVAADAMADQTLNKVGVVTETSGHWHHDVTRLVMELLPKKMFLNQMKSVRNKSMKKGLSP